MTEMFTVPNIISILRIISVPVLLALAWSGKPEAFLVLFVLALLTDCLDGFLARKLHQESTVGAQLDSWGDLALFVSAPVAAWLLWPDLVVREYLFIILALVSYWLPAIYGYIKFKRLPSYHTWGAKITAVLLGISAPLLFVGGPALPFRAATVALTLTALEEIAMTAILPAWQPDIPSFYHALARRRNQEMRNADEK